MFLFFIEEVDIEVILFLIFEELFCGVELIWFFLSFDNVFILWDKFKVFEK